MLKITGELFVSPCAGPVHTSAPVMMRMMRNYNT